MTWRGVEVIARPPEPPITLKEAKDVLAIYHEDDDELIESLIRAATAEVEGPFGALGIALMQQTWRLTLDAFPCAEIRLPGWPIMSITAIRYFDDLGAQQTLATTEYRLVLAPRPVRLVPTTRWPETASDYPGAVEIDYVLGQSDPTDIPADLRLALLHIVAHRFEHREAVGDDDMVPMPLSAQAMLGRFRGWTI